MRDFGEFPSLSLECSSVVGTTQIVCSMQQENKATSNFIELRYEVFTKKNVSEDRLRPTFSLNVNYQTFIWKSACVPVLNLPSLIGNELQMEGLKFFKEFTLNSAEPDTVVELARYKSQKGSKNNLSSCKH